MVHNWCKDVITAKQKSEQPPPLYSFISGGAETGKSLLIKALHQMVLRTLRKEGEEPTSMKVLLMAPTGTAAYNIQGLTIHSALQAITAWPTWEELSETRG